MNRQTLLHCIRRHVRESVTVDGDMRPLGEVVAKVLCEIESVPHAGEVPQANPSVIPVTLVAAFVDGVLTESESDTVWQAAITDRSVLAELVAAVRAIEQEAAQFDLSETALPAALDAPLESALEDRLLQMAGSLAPTTPPSPPLPFPTPTSPESSAPAPIDSPTPVIRVNQPPSRPGRRRSRPLLWIGALAASAAIAMLVFYLNNRNPRPGERDMVDVPGNVPVPEPDELNPRDLRPTVPSPTLNPNDTPPMVAIAPDKNVPPEPDDPQPNITTPIHNEPQPKMVVDPRPNDPREPMLVPDAPSLTRPRPTQFAGLRWKQITGILAEEKLLGQSSSARSVNRWSSVQENSVSYDSDNGFQPVMLRTLPLSRAEAELASGGRIVMRGESSAGFSATDDASVQLDLRHGGIALVDFPADTVVDLRSQDRRLGQLRWSKPTTTVLAEYAENGLVLHVQGDGVTIDDNAIDEGTVVLKPDQPAEPIATLKRLPTWVTRPVDTIAIPRTVLAQISQTNDLMHTMSQRISELARNPQLSATDQKTLAALIRWQVSLGEANLFRLAGSRIAAVRLLALEQLVELPEWDPRYKRIWSAVGRAATDQPQALRVQRLCQMLRSGRKPTDQQLSHLVAGLDAPSLATRALSDYLLRRFAGGGPTYDPTVTNQAQRANAINNWRRYLARVSTRN